MAAEITHPLSVVDELFSRHLAAGNAPSLEWGEKMHFAHALGLDDEERFAQIPCLNEVEVADSLPPFSLVRFRALVQDVFEPEIFEAVVQESDEATGESRPLTTKYREFIAPTAGKSLASLGKASYSQRGAYYCVPLPGETEWAQSKAAAWTLAGGGVVKRPVEPASSNRPKRSRPDEDMDMSADAVPPPPPAVGAPREKRRPGDTCNVIKPTSSPGADQFGLNFPIPSEEGRGGGKSVACIVKLYDGDAESLRLCEAVEFVGVLCVNPEAANFGEMEEWDARNPSTSFVPRLHAICLRRLPFQNPLVPYTPAFMTEARLAAAFQSNLAAPGLLAAIRSKAVEHLTSCLGGDTLAAQYVLMLLVSRSFAKHGEQSLGIWSLNLGCWPEGLDTGKLKDAIARMVPRVACYDITAETLNTQRWRPVKDFAANRLLASQLQLAAGTAVIFDETRMTEGQLVDAGVRNVHAIRSLVNEQQLVCDFESYEVKIPLEVQSINVSPHKSIISDIDVLLPLCPSAEVAAQCSCDFPSELLDALRLLVALVTRTAKPLRIPEEVAHKFGEDFAAARESRDIKPELAHTWMSLARAFCLTYGDDELTMEKWAQVLQMEGERLQRCREKKLLGP